MNIDIKQNKTGRELKAIMEQKGLNSYQIAEIAEVSFSTVDRCINGTHNTTQRNLKKLNRAIKEIKNDSQEKIPLENNTTKNEKIAFENEDIELIKEKKLFHKLNGEFEIKTLYRIVPK